MRTISKSLRILVAAMILPVIFYSCERDEELQGQNANDIIIGNWVISEFFNGDEELTGELSGYDFNCDAHGNMYVNGQDKHFNGNWSCVYNIDTIYRLNIMGCSPNSILLECMDDWQLTSHDSIHCYFSTYKSSHPRTMNWKRKG